MYDLETMSGKDAVRLAKDVSGLSTEEISRRSGIPLATMRRYLERSDSHLPSLERIPALCAALGNDVLTMWIQAKDCRDNVEVRAATSRAEVLTAVARAAASMGDVQRRLADSEDRGIDPACARDVRGHLNDVVLNCRRAQGMLYQQALARDITEAAPLCCLAEKKRPWWRRLFGG